jgi:modulator of FtsH protease
VEAPVVAGWTDFLAVSATTAGALVGLVFVALSINLARIIALPGVSGRAAETIILLSGALAESIIALIPHLSSAQLGWALLVVAAVTWTAPVLIQLRTALKHAYYQRSLALVRAALHQLAAVPAVLAAACLITLHPGGMDWLALGAIASMLVAIFNAWVLLVEIMR